MKTESYKCDGPSCPHVKGANNHWFMALKSAGALTIKPWTNSGADATGVDHLCGESCVQKTVSEFLTSQSRRNGETSERVRPVSEHALVRGDLVIEGSHGTGEEKAETVSG